MWNEGTVSPAIPVWDGCRPYEQVPVQISVHTEDDEGRIEHREWLAGSGQDPREAMARRILRYTAGARTILVYYQSFEQGRIEELQDAVPHLADDLQDVLDRMVDLLPVVREYVEHPALREIKDLDLDGMSPMQSFDVMRRLQDQLRGADETS